MKPPTQNEIMQDILQEHAYFVDPSLCTAFAEPLDATIAPAIASSETQKVAELEKEIAQLKGQLNRAKSINDAMWETVGKQLAQGDESKDRAAVNRVSNLDDDVKGGRKRLRS